jgi:phosphoribosylformylglycinamidine (FGAM) synthase PurS component
MKGFAISLGLHLAVLFMLFFQWPVAPAPATVPPAAVKLFVPADAVAEKSPPPQRKTPAPAMPQQHAAPKPRNKAKLDLAMVQITIENDIHGEMILVLKRYGGKIVVLDPATRAVQQAFSASTAKPVSGVAVTDGLAILLGDPAYWPDVIAMVNHAGADATVCALFPPDFVDALGTAIRKKATELGVTDIKAVTVAFSAGQRSGVLIRHIG